MVDALLRPLNPAEVAQRWAAQPLAEELSTYSPLDNHGRRSVLGEILAVAYDPDPWLSTLDHDASIVLSAQTLGIPRLHAELIDRVVSDHNINRRNRTGTTNEVAINALTNPAMYLGENVALIMAFGKLLDSYTPDQLRYIHSHHPSNMWEYEEERKRTSSGYTKPHYDFGYYGGKAVARLALIYAGVVVKAPSIGSPMDHHDGHYQPERPTPVELKYVDELAGFAINEVQTIGSKKGRQRLYFLPKFFDDIGKPLTLNWLKAHPAQGYSPNVLPDSVAGV